MPAKVIKSIHYKAPNGTTYSPFSSFIPADAIRVDAGFTIAWPDGTTGCGRKPFATEQEAQAHIDRNPNFKGMSQ